MARIYTRFLTAFTGQASNAISTDAFSSGSQTDFDTTASGNADGCDEFECEVDVTAAPSSEAQCLIYLEALQHDTTGYNEPRLVGSITIPVTVTNKYVVRVYDMPQKGKLKLYAATAGFTAALSISGVYSADT